VVFTIDDSGRGHFYAHAAVGAKITAQRLKAMHLDNQTIKLVTELIDAHLVSINDRSILRYLRRFGPEQLERLFEVKKADLAAHVDHAIADGMAQIAAASAALDQAIAAKACFSLADMAIGGDDLVAMGIKPGSHLGEILDALLDDIVDGQLANEREGLLVRAMELNIDESIR
jgi:tRNA nucleotidyltransferase/poly(A) polymerase